MDYFYHVCMANECKSAAGVIPFPPFSENVIISVNNVLPIRKPLIEDTTVEGKCYKHVING